MPGPSQSDLHVNVPLTNVSVAYMQSAGTYIADKVFPKIPSDKQSNLFWKYSKSDWRRTDVQKRAPGTETPGVQWLQDTDQYFCHVYGVHKDIDDQTRSNADSNFNLDRDATEFITNQLLLKRDIDWNSKYFKPGVWASNKVGTTDFVKWSDANSDPISDLADAVLEFRKLTGFAPNIAVLGADVMKELKQHPDIIDRIKYTQRGIVTEDLIATLFDIDELYTSYATLATVPPMNSAREQDAAATYSFITNTKGVLLVYAPKSPSLLTPSAGYTFTWKGYLGGNAQGIRVKRFRLERIASDRVEAEATYDQKIVCPDMGLFLDQVVV
jgi:hypothetical protein